MCIMELHERLAETGDSDRGVRTGGDTGEHLDNRGDTDVVCRA